MRQLCEMWPVLPWLPTVLCFTLSTEENKALHGHTTEIEAQLSDYTAEYQKLQDKHRTLTEYFEQKEHNLHRLVTGIDQITKLWICCS